MNLKQIAHLLPDLLKASASSGLQLIITLLATPIMTRLYAPEAYGEFGLVNTFAALLAGVGLVSLPAAYAQEHGTCWRVRLMRSIVALACGLTLFSVLVSAGTLGYQTITGQHYLSWGTALLLPLLVLSYTLWQPIFMHAVSIKAFDATAIARLVNAISARGLTLLGGALIASTSSLIVIATLLGNAFAAAYLLVKSHKHMNAARLHPRKWLCSIAPQKAKLKQCLTRYHDFAVYYTLTTQAAALLTFALQIIIASNSSKEITGHFMLASAILSLPVTLIAMASASIIFMHLQDIIKTKPSALLRHTLGLMLIYSVIGAIIMLPLIWLGPILFRIAFGENWEPAGQIAAALAPAYIGSFAAVALESIFRICHRLKLRLMLDVVLMPPLLLGIVACFKSFSFNEALGYTCMMLVLYYGLILLASLIVCKSVGQPLAEPKSRLTNVTDYYYSFFNRHLQRVNMNRNTSGFSSDAALAYTKSMISNPLSLMQAVRTSDKQRAEKRWQSPENLMPEWHARTKLMAGMVQPNSSVLEFGSGDERLREWLPSGCSYQPSDLFARSEHTIVCNLNESFPQLDQYYDVMVFSGVFEYIEDIPQLLVNIRKHCKSCITSYATLDKLSCMPTRLNSDYINHLTDKQLLSFFKQAGFTVTQTVIWDDLHTIYHLS